jgi:phosphoribosylanthranilate isomerase
MWLKICGITREADARLAAECGADAVGFVLWPGSPRYVSPEHAARLAATLPAGIERVGVFVDESPAAVASVVRDVGLTRVQFHGDETPATCASAPVPVVKAFAVGPSFRPAAVDAFGPALTVLLDADAGRARGGTGGAFDWAVARRVAARRPTILAGGLTPENVVEAIRTVCPHGVDVSSGVEARPGLKDADKVRRFVDAVRRAGR